MPVLGKLQLIAILAGIAIVLGIATKLSYDAGREGMRDEAMEMIDKRVGGVITQYETRISQQIELTNSYKDLADKQLADLQEGLEKIKGKQGKIDSEIEKDRILHPTVYSPKLPESGRKQWEEARKLLQ